MENSLKITWTKRALENLKSEIEFIALKDFSSSLKVLDRVEKAASTLGLFPESGRPGQVNETRELIVMKTSYIIPYYFDKKRNKIVIIRLLHSSRKCPSKFE